MPHTSRGTRSTKPKPKRAILDAGDGWSRVEYAHRGSGEPVRETLSMPPLDKELSVEKMRAEHTKIKARWLDSEHRKRLYHEMFGARAGELGRVRKAVCVALGSLSTSWHYRNRSVWQFALFMDLVDMLQAKVPKDERIRVFVQEPRFSDLDSEFFKSLDVTVLRVPEAEAEVGTESFVFVPCLEWFKETAYMRMGQSAPLYITSSCQWVIDQAEYTKAADTGTCSMEDCDNAIRVANEMITSHHPFSFDEGIQAVDALNFTYYVLKSKQELDTNELESKIGLLEL